jgi:hypothetical protein
MKKYLLLLPLLLATSCGTLSPGSDSIVVRSEQTRDIALTTFDAFVKFEYNNRAYLLTINPGIKNAADTVRAGAPKWISDFTIVLNVYKKNRTVDNQANLATALATLDAALATAQSYLATASDKVKTQIP